jgi:hypothetical protein
MSKANWWKTLMGTAALVAILSTGAAAQANKDLEITDISVEVSGDDFRILPEIKVTSTGGGKQEMPVDVMILFDGTVAEVVADIIDFVVATHTCPNYTPPDCGQGNCLTVYGFNAYVDGVCERTLVSPNYVCACIWILHPYGSFQTYELQEFCTVIVDPYDAVPELDETNNEMTIALVPVPNESRSWTAVKAMYR